MVTEATAEAWPWLSCQWESRAISFIEAKCVRRHQYDILRSRKAQRSIDPVASEIKWWPDHFSTFCDCAG